MRLRPGSWQHTKGRRAAGARPGRSLPATVGVDVAPHPAGHERPQARARRRSRTDAPAAPAARRATRAPAPGRWPRRGPSSRATCTGRRDHNRSGRPRSRPGPIARRTGRRTSPVASAGARRHRRRPPSRPRRAAPRAPTAACAAPCRAARRRRRWRPDGPAKGGPATPSPAATTGRRRRRHGSRPGNRAAPGLP